MNILEAHFYQSLLKLPWCYVRSELADKSRSKRRNNPFFLSYRPTELKYLRFIGDSAKWTIYHTHSTGNTFFIVDLGSSILICLNCLYSTGTLTWAFQLSDSIVRADFFTFTAFNTFFLINHRFSVYYIYCAFRADLTAWVSYAALA